MRKHNWLTWWLRQNCLLCDRPADGIICVNCDRQLKELQRKDSYSDRGLIWGNYEGLLKRALFALKYDRKRDLGTLFGNYLAEAWLASARGKVFDKNPPIVVPIPLHPQRLATRGFNQAEIIAEAFVRQTGYPLSLGLSRQRNTAPQFGLQPAERITNLAEAFQIDRRANLPVGSRILIIDDIYTTGATINSAFATLQTGKMKPVGFATIATARVTDR
jgi:ComF family protein